MPDTDAVLRDVMDRWQAGINAAQPERVADAFTDDAVFQGLRPYTVGRAGVDEYYRSQPAGMAVSYRILEARRPADDVVHGYLEAQFTFPDRDAVLLHLGVVVCCTSAGWQIAQYQAS